MFLRLPFDEEVVGFDFIIEEIDIDFEMFRVCLDGYDLFVL